MDLLQEFHWHLADTIGVAFEKGIEGKRIGTAGWWNTIAFTEAAKEEGLVAKTLSEMLFQMK